MSKVTSKLQVTIPKVLAENYGIRPGDEVRWEALARGPLMVAETAVRPRLTPEERVALLRESFRRQKERQRGKRWKRGTDRGWAREDLYDGGRGLSR